MQSGFRGFGSFDPSWRSGIARGPVRGVTAQGSVGAAVAVGGGPSCLSFISSGLALSAEASAADVTGAGGRRASRVLAEARSGAAVMVRSSSRRLHPALIARVSPATNAPARNTLCLRIPGAYTAPQNDVHALPSLKQTGGDEPDVYALANDGVDHACAFADPAVTAGSPDRRPVRRRAGYPEGVARRWVLGAFAAASSLAGLVWCAPFGESDGTVESDGAAPSDGATPGDGAAPNDGPGPSDAGPGRVSGDLVALYTFREGTGTRVSDLSGTLPLDLTIASSAAVAWTATGLRITSSTKVSAPSAKKIVDAVNVSNEVSIEAWVTPQDAVHDGPARIVSISQDPYNRDATLGASLDRYVTRLRTDQTAPNGVGAGEAYSPFGQVRTVQTHLVFARDAAGGRVLYIDAMPYPFPALSGLLGWVDFPLVLVNEDTANTDGGDRPWLGELHLVAIYARALAASEVAQNFAAGPRPQ